MNQNRWLLTLLFAVHFVNLKGQTLPSLNQSLGDVHVQTKGHQLIVQTATLERIWQWTGQGLVTVSLRNRKTGKQWAEKAPNYGADWAYFGVLDNANGQLNSLTVRESDDEGFTARHLSITAEITYPQQRCSVRYEIWAYPNSPGIRTCVWFKGARPQPSATNTVQRIPPIRLLDGQKEAPSAAQPTANRQSHSLEVHPKALQYQLSQLKPDKQYILGGSWLDYNNEGRVQKMRLTRIDREAEIEVIGPTALSATPQPFSIPIPSSLLTDGSVRLYIDRLKGPNAAVAELWLYEKTTEDAPYLTGDTERINALQKQAPLGYKLVYFHNSSETLQDEKKVATGRVDYVPVSSVAYQRRFVGYYNDTQNRNTPKTPILREEVDRENSAITNSWASLVSLEQKNEGLVMVKESHKCVNQYGVDTGEFQLDNTGLSNTGTSLFADDWSETDYRWAWASWVIAYEGGDDYRELAIKQFDRLRFPTRPERDMYTLTCTWGHSLNVRDGRNYAWEKNILPEMDLTQRMGIDMLLIDDGWQVSSTSKTARPDSANGWYPHPEVYPKGWQNVIAQQKKLGIKLGLWGIAQEMPLEAMKKNWDQLHFNQLKLDFASFNDHRALDKTMRAVRAFVAYTQHKSSISWDLTENPPRYGYFWAREYGNLHLMNRKPETPESVVYVPWLALRDFWLLSRYTNLNKFQLTIHNPEVVNRQRSDAYQHSPAYCAATGLMGVPEFMAIPRYYSESARDSIRNLLQIYQTHRPQIWQSFIFPVGDEPTNQSFSGFQAYQPSQKEGYLLLFRELHSEKSMERIKVRFLAGKTIVLTNLRTNKIIKAKVDKTGFLTVSLEKAADFMFLKYQSQ